MSGESVTIYAEPQLQDATLVVAWAGDAGRLGPGVVEHLDRRLGGKTFAEIEPVAFFPLNGVAIADDVARFPESKFNYCPDKSLALLKSDPPAWEWHDFLNTLLDVAQQRCHVKEILTLGGMVSVATHTAPRPLMAVSNSPEMARNLSQYDISPGVDYDTHPTQRPTMSSYLLWLAQKRNIPAASLWVAVPFYLVAVEDPRAWSRAAAFLNEKLGLAVDLAELDERAAGQDRSIAEVRERSPDLDGLFRKLESATSLTPEESERFVRGIGEALRRRP
ncbi:MAG: PAC2 family protein [Chloroflexi bacterium]|nr:PAC2 family protein [Chloroflexota bacterium]